MEPVTHFMTGAVLARAGLNRRAAYATLAMTLAAEAPDLDTLWGLHGPVASFQHHRGITHTFLGFPVEAAVVVGVVWLIHRWRLRRAAAAALAHPTADTAPLTIAPVRWGLLYGFVLLALLSHILLDWTNNYGIRPFFPFDPHWYAASIVFIFEPVLFAVLLAALVLPALFGLVGSEVGARTPAFRGRGWAIFALLSTLALWGWRFAEHNAALRLAQANDYSPLPVTDIRRIVLSPYPVNPFRWHAVIETPGFYQLATIDALAGTVVASPQDTLYKPPTTIATLVAKRSWLGEVYLDWSSIPIVTDIGPATPPGDNPAQPLTAVTFQDPRFMYDVAFLHGRTAPPISGTVYIDDDRRIAQMVMGRTVQRMER